MALLDVSDVLTDPDFMDEGLICKRSTQTVGDNGRAVLATQSTSFAAVVTSDKGDFLERLAGGERKKGSIKIRTVFRLTSGTGDTTADIVTWQGRDYTVARLDDYAHFGEGFVCA